jgi:hypothetical protein
MYYVEILEILNINNFNDKIICFININERIL